MILRGWKDICKAMGGITPRTARRLKREEGLPIDDVAGQPQTTDALLEEWVEKRVKGKLGASEGTRGSFEGLSPTRQ